MAGHGAGNQAICLKLFFPPRRPFSLRENIKLVILGGKIILEFREI